MQLQRHKRSLVNGHPDPALSASLSGILLAPAVIDARQRDAADRFGRARAACFGVVLGDRDPSTRREVTEDQVVRNTARYQLLLALLDRDQRRAVIGLALDQRRPWMLRAMLGRCPIGDDQQERAALLSGLEVLAGPGEE